MWAGNQMTRESATFDSDIDLQEIHSKYILIEIAYICINILATMSGSILITNIDRKFARSENV